MILFLGALLGFISVAFGAYSEHGLQPKVSAEIFRQVMTGVRYNQVHAVVVSALGLFLLLSPDKNLLWFNVAGYGLVIGTMLFSFSIYAAAMLANPEITRLAPIGGITIMVAWLVLAYCGLRGLG